MSETQCCLQGKMTGPCLHGLQTAVSACQSIQSSGCGSAFLPLLMSCLHFGGGCGGDVFPFCPSITK